MRKLVLLILSLISLSAAAQLVTVDMPVVSLTQGESGRFDVVCSGSHELEIVVFTEGHLISMQKVVLSEGKTPFDFSTEGAPTGKYFVLVTGQDIHVEKEFTLRKRG